MGTYLLERLASLRDSFKIVGDVRGKGLMLGVEFVEEGTTKPLATDQFMDIWERCKNMGVLLGRGGNNGNVSIHT